jgi:serine/threonine-protein kinase
VDIEQLAGTKLGNYEIESLLGRGGMGVVYKARQLSLNRPVALKFLPPELIGSHEWKERFFREAQAAAALAHPNICTIHEINEVDDKVFIAMEYLKGQSLDKKIESGALDIDEAVNVALRVAEGLGHAHKRGVVHRDIKPANIMITGDGQTKIMDFGLAKLSGKTRLTKTATVMGTITYMSPEQARGDKDISCQTDIWSLGVMLYEMLTGRLPFDAETDTGLIYKIINENPELITNHRSDIPGSLVSLIEKAIQKDPQNRYKAAEMFVADLEAVKSETSTSKGSTSPSIAVLPFVNMSADPDQEYFCDGLAEELINALTQLKDLKVIARTSAFSFRGKEIDVRDIGKKLDVGTVLEGSVRKAGKRLRITAQLINTAQGHHLWSEKYDRNMEDVFAIQDEISEAIVAKLKPKLLGEEKEKLAKRQPANLEAYNLYLKGRYFLNKGTQEDVKKAIECFRRAIEEEPDYALAYCGLSESWSNLPFYGSFPPQEAYLKGREAALRALEIDDTLGEAHCALALNKVDYEWDWEGAEREFRRGIELNPGYAISHQWYAFLHQCRGRFDEAIMEMKKALELDPLSQAINRDLGTVYLYSRQYEQAAEASRKALEMDPNNETVRIVLGGVYLWKLMLDEAMTEFQKAKEISTGLNTIAEIGIAASLALGGKRAEAERIVDDLIRRSEEEYVSRFWLSTMYFLLGDLDSGFESLEKAYERREHWMCYFKVQQAFDVVRTDPRYISLLKRIGLDK